jgi:tripartite-type tricarboxylate transporter receptor subunit TctC
VDIPFSRVLVSIVAAVFACAAGAQSYPSKPIRIVIPFPPGNTMDIMARLIAPKLTERLGQNVIVDNRAGAAGQLGMELGKSAPPDGYTIIAGQGGNMVVMPHTYKKLPYDVFKDFAPISLSTTNFLGLVVHPSVPFKTVKDLVVYAKANPNKITFGSNGEGGFPHMTIELLRVMAGFTYVHVPYKGSAQIATDLIGGHIDAAIDGITGLTPHIRSGKLRLLAITNPTRVSTFEGTPTVAESVSGYDSRGWFGFIAPAGTPREIVALLNAEINRAMALPDVREKLTSAGLFIVNESPEYFASVLKSDYAKYGKLIRDINFQPQ